jgi:2-methylcitrate dehydratase
VHTLSRAAKILSDPSKYDPRTRETADHSLPYVLAAALVDRQVTPGSFTMEKILNPRIREQLRKVELVGDPEIDASFPKLQRTIVKITLTDGRTLTHQLEFPKGDPRNPLSDQEVEEKFMSLTCDILPRPAQERLKDAIWNLERLEAVSELMSLTGAARPATVA